MERKHPSTNHPLIDKRGDCVYSLVYKTIPKAWWSCPGLWKCSCFVWPTNHFEHHLIVKNVLCTLCKTRQIYLPLSSIINKANIGLKELKYLFFLLYRKGKKRAIKISARSFNALLECVQITIKAERSMARSVTGSQIVLHNDLAVVLVKHYY